MCVNIKCNSISKAVDTDPTKSLESKVTRTLQQIKHMFEENEY